MLRQLLHSLIRQKEKTSVIPSKQSPAEKKTSLQTMALEAAANGVVITDKEGIIQWINPAFTELTGYTSEEAVGKSTRILNSGKQDKSFYENLWRTILAGKMWHGEIIDRKKDGSLYTEEQTITPVKDEDGKIISFIAIKQDVTDRKKLEKELVSRNIDLERQGKTQRETTQAMLNVMEDLEAAKGIIELEKVKDEAMLASIGEGLIAVDNNRKIMIMNKAAENMLGWKIEEIIGRELNSLSLEDEKGDILPLEKRPITTALNNGKAINSIYYFVRKDKTRFPTAIYVTPIKLGGKIIGAIEIFRDITREKEIDRAKSEFISLASHQLRTPLTAIKWFGEMLLSGDAGKLQKEQAEYVQNIFQSNERMIALVNSLLNISRMESGRLIVEPFPTDLATLVKEVIDELKVKIEKKKQNMIVDIDPLLPKINIDPRLVRNVYMNLLTNAIKYTPEKGKISVSISQKGDQIISEVTDTGVGIDSKEQHRVFEKFFRGENIIKIEPDGTGLGLYLAKSIVESSNGKIWFESAEGKGARFWFSLPIKGVPAKTGEVILES